ncbi:MAG: phosphatidylserine decarboxylase [Planctomycetota bacterium]|jgi:phosphatidylserine decarboxylase
MRIPLTKYGLPQVIAYPAMIIAAMIAYLVVGVLYLSAWAVISVEVLLAAALLWVFSFFRDPHRPVSVYKEILLAPADGKVTDIEIVAEDNFIGGRALRIGVFLGIFDVHINRAPCNVKVEKITYKPGKYKNALNPAAGHINESNDVGMTRTDSPEDKLVVRQISGAITRRIVCTARQGQQLTGGEKFGMIKFGSRTELYLPVREDAKCLVRVGDKVKAGLTPIVKYEIQNA